MSTSIFLLNFTEKGAKNIKGSPKRGSDFIKIAEKFGVQIKGMYWTIGGYDGVLIIDAPNEEAAATLSFSLEQSGNVRTTPLRAFTRAEFETILANLD